MVPRRFALLALVALGLSAGGCAAAAAASTPATWHSPSAAAGAGGGGASPTASASPSPSATHSKPPKPSPSDTPSNKPTGPKSDPPAPPSGVATGHGPHGSMSVTGTSQTALTFDDGPGPYTSQILDLLEQNHVKATFCMIGRQVASYPNEVRRMVADGDTLCNHTWSHDEQLSTRTDAQIRAELQQTNDAIHAIVPTAKIEYFRNPAGNFADNTVAIAASMGMKSLYWSVDPSDWKNPGTQTSSTT